MKVTFEIEIDDVLVKQLDYYEHFGDLHSPEAGCNKCVFLSMCNDWCDVVGDKFPVWLRDCKFPCFKTMRDRACGTNRQVFIMNPNYFDK
jgi:hypothetical protein